MTYDDSVSQNEQVRGYSDIWPPIYMAYTRSWQYIGQLEVQSDCKKGQEGLEGAYIGKQEVQAKPM